MFLGDVEQSTLTMKSMTSKLSLLLTGVLLTLPFEAQAQNLLTNGSFEQYSGGATDARFPDTLQGITSQNGWTLNDSNHALFQSASSFADAAQHYYQGTNGSYFTEFAGAGADGREWAEQTVSIIGGQTYRLSFDHASGGIWWQSAGIWVSTGGTAFDVDLSGAFSYSHTYTHPTSAFDGTTPPAGLNPTSWVSDSYDFTPGSSGNLTVRFTALNGGTNWIDNTSLTTVTAAPEPTGAVLLGAAGLLAIVRRRRLRCAS